jgi:hypothetical protein
MVMVTFKSQLSIGLYARASLTGTNPDKRLTNWAATTPVRIKIPRNAQSFVFFLLNKFLPKEFDFLFVLNILFCVFVLSFFVYAY